MKSLKRLLCAVLCFVLLFTFVGTGRNQSALTAEAATSAEIQKQLDALKQESNKLQAEISAMEAANAPYEKQRAAVQKQINATINEINLYEKQIEACEKEMAALDKQIDALEKKCDKYYDEFKQRMVAIYTGKNSFLSDLSFLMSSQSLSDYLAKAELLESVSRRDSKLIDKLKKDVADIEAKKSEHEAKKATLAAAKKEIDAKKVALNSQYAKVNAIYMTNEEAIKIAEQEAADKKQMEKDLKKALEDALIYENGATGTGQFAWPVPGFYKVTSPYGYRTHPVTGEKNKMHTGIDIAGAGVYGAKIMAADNGTVILNKSYGGYGWCVMISHNNGYVTLYAHMKAQSTLKVGTNVYKGKTVVGYVGSSGTATGPHLHFEIQKNNQHTDPMKYF